MDLKGLYREADVVHIINVGRLRWGGHMDRIGEDPS